MGQPIRNNASQSPRFSGLYRNAHYDVQRYGTSDEILDWDAETFATVNRSARDALLEAAPMATDDARVNRFREQFVENFLYRSLQQKGFKAALLKHGIREDQLRRFLNQCETPNNNGKATRSYSMKELVDNDIPSSKTEKTGVDDWSFYPKGNEVPLTDLIGFRKSLITATLAISQLGQYGNLGTSVDVTRGMFLGPFQQTMMDTLKNKMGLSQEETFNFIEKFLDVDWENKQAKATQQQTPPALPAPKDAQPAQNTETPKNDFASFTVDMTERALKGQLRPVIGRTEEIQDLRRALNRSMNRRAIVIGEAGVGKTAIVEGLAHQLAKEDPSIRIMKLDLGDMVAGTKYRGELEQKLKGFLKHVENNAEKLVVFIDEAHTIMHAGAAEGGLTVGNMLKTFMDNPEVRVISATTTDEYEKYIAGSDAATARRFGEPIKVHAPNKKDTLEIVKGILPRFNRDHKVAYPQDIVEAAYDWSRQYIIHRQAPDVQLEVLDKAGVLAKEQVDKGERKDALVTMDDIGRVVSKISGVPLGTVNESEDHKLKRLADTLRQRVIGQDQAIEKVSEAIQANRLGLTDNKGPIGVFLFAGPTGVGKTELAKALGEWMAGEKGKEDDRLVRLNGGELTEQHAVSKIIGAPPGYVGYQDGGSLVDQVRKKPYSVILIDEVEKIHPDARQPLLSLMDDGMIKDSKGRMVNAKNTIVILTSNVGARNMDDAMTRETFGFLKKNTEDRIKDAKDAFKFSVKDEFSPEFLNRLDVVLFNPLSKDVQKQIIEMNLKGYKEKLLKDKGIDLQLTDTAKDYLAGQLFPKPGAEKTDRQAGREVLSIIKNRLQIPLARFLLANGLGKSTKLDVAIKVDAGADGLGFTQIINAPPDSSPPPPNPPGGPNPEPVLSN